MGEIEKVGMNGGYRKGWGRRKSGRDGSCVPSQCGVLTEGDKSHGVMRLRFQKKLEFFHEGKPGRRSR